MTEDSSSQGVTGANSSGGLPQHPLVERLKPDPAQPAKRVIELTGLPGESDRPGYQRLYLTSQLEYYAEFPREDIVHSEILPADRSPFSSLESTRVSVRREATISYTWVRSYQPVDEFDLDVRLGPSSTGRRAIPQDLCDSENSDCGGGGGITGTCGTCACTDTCVGVTCRGTCDATCRTCQTDCRQGTCNTCDTQCNQATCANTCNQATCQTCQTQCGTCETQCGTCRTQCGTCVACTHATCFNTCAC
jgi:hypothetical protein